MPITSGLREIALLNELGIAFPELRRSFRERWMCEVVGPNEADALQHAQRARASNPGLLVVDPSRLTVKGWEQDDYNGFWVRLMERHAVRLIAVPGWEFSRGARGEVGFAMKLGCPVAEPDGVELSRFQLEAIDASAREKLAADGWSQEQIEAYLPAVGYDATPVVELSPASQTFDWLVRERAYQVRKFGTELDDGHTREGLGEDGWWWRQVTTYFHRSRVLTLDTVVGRQALAKFTATACGLLESAIRVHGRLPQAGASSGTIEQDDHVER